jgi:hypothetical protein
MPIAILNELGLRPSAPSPPTPLPHAGEGSAKRGVRETGIAEKSNIQGMAAKLVHQSGCPVSQPPGHAPACAFPPAGFSGETGRQPLCYGRPTTGRRWLCSALRLRQREWRHHRTRPARRGDKGRHRSVRCARSGLRPGTCLPANDSRRSVSPERGGRRTP